MMIETCRSIFKSLNVNNLSVCIGWCADQVTLRSAPCNDKDDTHVVFQTVQYNTYVVFQKVQYIYLLLQNGMAANTYEYRLTQWMWQTRGSARPFPNYYGHRNGKIREKCVAEEIST